MRIIIDNTDHGEGLTLIGDEHGTIEVPPWTTATLTVFEPRLVVADDAIYVAHDDGFVRKWTLVGEIEEAFDPIPISGPNQEETP